MQFLKITIFIFLFLCASFSLSEGFCEKSIESFSGPKGQFNHFFRNNFISKAVRNRLQEKHDERELKASVREWEQLREGRFKAEREAIELKITQAEQQLDSEELKLEKSRSERLQARYGIKGKYSAEQVRSNWESRLAIAEIRHSKTQENLQQLKEKLEQWLKDVRDKAEEELRKIERSIVRMERELISAKVDLDVVKKRLVTVRRNKNADQRIQAEKDLEKAEQRVRQARNEFKRRKLELQSAAERLERREADLRQL